MSEHDQDDYALFRKRLREAHQDADELAAALLELYEDPYAPATRARARKLLEQRGALQPLDDRTCVERRRDRDKALAGRRRAAGVAG